jgi:hypothetical protein
MGFLRQYEIQKAVMGSFLKVHHARLHVASGNGSLVQAPQTMKHKRELFKMTEGFI